MEKKYPSDLSDEQWRAVEPFVKRSDPRGNPGRHDRRTVLNAILYVLRGGISWRMLPKDFPPFGTVYDHFRRWNVRGIWAELNATLTQASRLKAGREAQPSVGIIDSQSVKTSGPGAERGFHGGKRIKGRSRHIVTDTAGRVLALRVSAANRSDSAEAGAPMAQALERFPTLETFVADQGYQAQAQAAAQQLGCSLQVVQKQTAPGFHVLPWRWVVERTFAWFGNFRRLSKDYEKTTTSSEAFLWLASSSILLNRLSKAL